MKLFTIDGRELMDVTDIMVSDGVVLVSGAMMMAMPIQVTMTGRELRKAIPLLSLKVIRAAVNMLLSKDRSAAASAGVSHL